MKRIEVNDDAQNEGLGLKAEGHEGRAQAVCSCDICAHGMHALLQLLRPHRDDWSAGLGANVRYT